MRLIDADALILALETQDYSCAPDTLEDWTPQDLTRTEIADIQHAPTIEAEPVKDTIYKFSKYQIEWLTSHNDITLCLEEEDLIVHFLEETAKCAVWFGMDEVEE